MSDAPDILPLAPDFADGRCEPALARVAGVCERLFRIVSPWAPGLAIVGAQADPARIDALPGLPRLSATGSGDTEEEALASCLGEMAERLSLCERAGDATLRAPFDAVADRAHHEWRAALQARVAGEAPLDWSRARDGEGRVWLVPTDLVFLRPRYDGPADGRPPASLGAAVGRTLEQARASALFELIERAAASDWWRGATTPASLEPGEEAAARARLALWRGSSEPSRRTLLLALPCAGAACVAALSCDAAAPTGWAIGVAARATQAAAADSALREMLQNEVGLTMARLRREVGAPPAPGDGAHLARDAWRGDARMSPAAPAHAADRAAAPIITLEIDLSRACLGPSAVKLLRSPQNSQILAGIFGERQPADNALAQGWTCSPPLF